MQYKYQKSRLQRLCSSYFCKVTHSLHCTQIETFSVVAGKLKYMLQILPLKPRLFQKIVFFLCKKHFANKINFPLPVETKFTIISL